MQYTHYHPTKTQINIMIDKNHRGNNPHSLSSPRCLKSLGPNNDYFFNTMQKQLNVTH